MELNINLIATVVVNLVLIGIAWGTLSTRVKNVETCRDACASRFKAIEDDHAKSISDLTQKIDNLSKDLNQLIGKFDMLIMTGGQHGNKNA